MHDFHSPFPSSFVLPNICEITSSVFELKTNSNDEGGKLIRAAEEWFDSFHVYSENKALRWLEAGRFDLFAILSFPDADLERLETCLFFFLWAFSTDDQTDEGDLQCRPGEVDSGHNASRTILWDPEAPKPEYPYAAMLWDLLRRIRSSSSAGTVRRFIQGYQDWSTSQVQQASNRNLERMPPVEEFIAMRRATIGGALVEAMVEYSLDINLPDFVFEDPTFIAMSLATTDILTWPNDLCSFNKEQADGDYQNLVCVLQHAYKLTLQEAVDMLTQMIENRMEEYVSLKERLPSFGPEVDKELRKYHTAIENFTQGCIVWYYSSPRYFGKDGVPPLGKKEIVIELFPRNVADDAKV